MSVSPEVSYRSHQALQVLFWLKYDPNIHCEEEQVPALRVEGTGKKRETAQLSKGLRQVFRSTIIISLNDLSMTFKCGGKRIGYSYYFLPMSDSIILIPSKPMLINSTFTHFIKMFMTYSSKLLMSKVFLKIKIS